MELKYLSYDNAGIARAIVIGDSKLEYDVAIDVERGLSWCTCPYFLYNKSSLDKHISFVLKYIDFNKAKNRRKELLNLKSGCNVIDSLLGGGFPYGITTALTGAQETGKSFLMAQLALANISQTGKNSIIIETEGYREEDYINNIASKMLDRFKLKKSDLKKLKFISVVSDWENSGIAKLCKLLGYDLITTSKKPSGENKGVKIQVHFIPTKPDLNKRLLENTGFIGLDSLTAPIKFNIGSEQQNLPARAQVEERIFGQSFMIAKSFNIAFVISHHVSINPQIPQDLGKSYGGLDVLYNSKYGIQLMHGAKTGRIKWGNEARRVMMVRIPGIQKNYQKFDIRLKKDWGFVDE